MKIVSLILGLILSSTSVAADVIRIGFSHFPPLSSVDDGICRGLFCELTKEIFEQQLGLKVQAVEHPWERIQRQVELGKIDVMLALPSEHRRGYGLISEEPIYLSEMKVFTYKDHPRLDEIKSITTLDDIKQKNLTCITNQGNAWHEKNVASLGIPTVHAISDEHIIKMLAAQRGDLVIDMAPSMQLMMDNLNLTSKLISTGVTLDRAEIHVIVSRRSSFADRMPEINEIIASMNLR
mgnify:CR=1 FL=1|tara:strand:+ start:25907 stop:26617 length:711 start_codon:yes stop_codon:yes gene_type:complete